MIINLNDCNQLTDNLLHKVKHIVYAYNRQEVGYVTYVRKNHWLCEANYYHKDKDIFQYDTISIQPTRKKAEEFLFKNWRDNFTVNKNTGCLQLEK